MRVAVTIVAPPRDAAATWDELARLQGAVWPDAAGRDPAWVRRRLDVFRVPEGGVLAARSARPEDAGRWVGYALVGLPPSQAPWARAAGMGVCPKARGAGVGRLLVEAMRDAARRMGAAGLRLQAEPHLEGYYTALGFGPGEACDTWASPAGPKRPEGAGTTPRRAARRAGPEVSPSSLRQSPGVAAGGSRVLAGYLPEAWSRSPTRRTLRSGGLVALVYQDRAGLVTAKLSCESTRPLPSDLAALAAAAAPSPLFVPGVPRSGPLPDALAGAGFRPVQRARFMEQHFDGAPVPPGQEDPARQ